MDPQTLFCPNPACPARGQTGQENIAVHSRKERRYLCRVCHKTFAETKGTVFYRLHKPKDIITLVLTLLAHGCPLQAVVVAFGFDERTVKGWLTTAGQHCEQVHAHWVQQPRDLGQVQADEIRVKMQKRIVWLALALQVSTRLWLGGVVSEHRDEQLLTQLIRRIRASALCRPMLFCVDGWRAYLPAIRHVFREAIPTGKLGRPILRPWDNVCIAQMVKQYAQGHVVGVIRRIAQGSADQVAGLLKQSQGGGVINTAYVERLNATFRARLASLVRRSRALARQPLTLHHGLYLIGTVYNFCTNHESLRLPLYVGKPGRRHWVGRTPAMAAGLTDHRWTMHELLSYRVPLSRWTPPRQRGPRSNTTKQLIQQWCC
jgi:transposase-like protein/IS1 family transposase